MPTSSDSLVNLGGSSGIEPSNATPAAPSETPTAGTSTEYSRGDHAHPKDVSIPDPSTTIPVKADDQTGAIGTSTDFMREDAKAPLPYDQQLNTTSTVTHKRVNVDLSDSIVTALKSTTSGVSTAKAGEFINTSFSNTSSTVTVNNGGVSFPSIEIEQGNLRIVDLASNPLIGTDSNGDLIAGVVDVAMDIDITNQTPNKIVDATRILNENLMSSNSTVKTITQSSLVAYVSNQTAGGVTYRGVMPIPADMTTNTTGNAYADGSSGYLVGDMFVAGSGGILTLSDGSITVANGDALIVNTVTPDASITVVMVDKIESSSSVATVFGRTGTVTADADDYTASKVTNVANGNISSINVQDAIDELDLSKLEKELTSSNIFVGNVSNVAIGVVVSGDATIDNSGAIEVVQATASVAGKVELATIVEAEAGTATNRALTPEGGESTYVKLSSNDLPTDHICIITGQVTNPTKATNRTEKGYYSVSNGMMTLHYRLSWSDNTGAAAGSGIYFFSIPTDYVVDSGKIDTSGIGNTEPVVGSCKLFSTSPSVHSVGVSIADGSNSNITLFVESGGFISNANGALNASGINSISFTSTFPVVAA